MLIERLKERYGSAILTAESARDEETIVIDRNQAHEVMQMLHDDPALSFNFLSDLTAVDWPERTPRFDVVYHLRSLTHGHRLRVKIGVDGTDPWVHSVALVWK